MTRRDAPPPPCGLSARPSGKAAVAFALVGLLGAMSGCGGGTTAVAPPPPADEVAAPGPAEELAARVAAAKDMRYTATYRLGRRGEPDRTVRVELATDGTWRLDVPGGAHGGHRDVAIAGTRLGIFQCRLDGATGCTRVAAPGEPVPAAYDPRVHLPFTDWLDVLRDPDAPLSVDHDRSLSVPDGDCYSVEPTAAALAAPVDPGRYCFTGKGVLTGASFGSVTLTLSSGVGQPPGTVQLPGPVTTAEPLPTSSPPRTASPTRSGG